MDRAVLKTGADCGKKQWLLFIFLHDMYVFDIGLGNKAVKYKRNMLK